MHRQWRNELGIWGILTAVAIADASNNITPRAVESRGRGFPFPYFPESLQFHAMVLKKHSGISIEKTNFIL